MSPAISQSSRPAILGGTPVVTLPQDEACRWPIITDEDEQAVLSVLRSGELSIHPIVLELEAAYRERLGVRHALAHNNGTGALHAAMHAVGIEPGDEVIVQSGTWWASVMPILHQGGVPVFAECDPATGGLDPADVEARITERTKAIVVVHLFGMPSAMQDLLAIAEKHDLRIIEDASHAHGAMYHGKPVGALGDIGVFSMQGNKLVPSAEGGVLLTNDDDLYVKALRYGHYERLIPMKEEPNRRFAATGFGMKFRMSPLSAAVATTQLARLDERNAQRNEACIYLSKQLAELGIEPFLAPEGIERVYFEFLVSFRGHASGLTAPELAEALRREGAAVEAPRYPLLHQQPMFTEGRWASIARITPDVRPLPTYDPMALPRTMAHNQMLLKLPSFPRATRELLDQYAEAFRNVLAHAEAVHQELA